MGIIKTFSEYLTESTWGDMRRRAEGEEIRREDAPAFNWEAYIDIETIAGIYSGGSYLEELESSERKEVRQLFRGIKDKIRKDASVLKANGLSASFEPGRITITGLNEKNLLYLTKKLIEEWVNDVNTLYVSDIEKILPFDDIQDDLDDDYAGLMDAFEKYIYSTIES